MSRSFDGNSPARDDPAVLELIEELRALLVLAPEAHSPDAIAALLALERVARRAGPELRLRPRVEALREEIRATIADALADELERAGMAVLFRLDHRYVERWSLDARREQAASVMRLGPAGAGLEPRAFRREHEPGYLETIAQGLVKRDREAAADGAAARLFGRTEQLADVVAAVLAGAPRPVAITGPPGIGKTRLARALAADDRVRARFARVHVVSYAGGGGAEGLIGAIRSVAGEEVAPRGPQVIDALRGDLLIVDDLRAPWEPDVVDLLARIAQEHDPALVCCIQGGLRPSRLAWGHTVELAKLEREAAIEALSAFAGRQVSGEPGLEEMLTALDGLPLALEIAGTLAQSEPFELLHASWLIEGTGMLALAADGVSLEPVYRRAVERLDAHGRDLLALLARLPNGVAVDELEDVMAGAIRAQRSLRAAALIEHDRAAGRLRLHSLIGTFAGAHCALAPATRDRAVRHYCALTQHRGPRIKLREAVAERRWMNDERANIDWAIGEALARDPAAGIATVIALTDRAWFSGISLEPVAKAALLAAKDDAVQRVDLFNARGLAALARSEHDAAAELFAAAWEHRAEVSADRVATSALGLAEVALRTFRDGCARERFERAAELYRGTAAEPLGVANCLLGLGQIDLRGGRLAEATARFDAAAALYEAVPDPLGVANCVKARGDVEWRRIEPVRAQRGPDDVPPPDDPLRHLDEALATYRDLNHVLGEASCLRARAEIALAIGEIEPARADFAAALTLFADIGNVLGDANGRSGLAEIALVRGELDRAREGFERARPGYAGIGCLVGRDMCEDRLAGIARAAGEPGAIAKRPPRPFIPDDNA